MVNKYYRDFRDLMNTLADSYQDKPAISIYTKKAEKKTYSYLQLKEDVESLAAYLLYHQLDHCHIAIVSENSYEWAVASFAIGYVQSVCVAIDHEQSDQTIMDMLKAADSQAVFCSRTFVELCKEFQTLPLYQSKDCCFQDLLAEGKSYLYTVAFPELDNRCLSHIVYTSGSTSTSKAVMHSQYAILTNARDVLEILDVNGKVFTALPFYHMYGYTSALLSVLMAGEEVCINGDIKTLLRDLRLFEPVIIMAVPLIVETLHKMIWEKIQESEDSSKAIKRLRSRKFPLSFFKTDFSFRELIQDVAGQNLNMMVCGGAHLSKSLIEDFEKIGVMILNGYGITEFAPVVSVNSQKMRMQGSVGKVIPHCHIKMNDGEILIKGDCLMLGYYQQELLTKDSFDNEGYFKTGDVGEYRDGYLYITGRKKNIIVFKNGNKVSPEEIEMSLITCPYIKDVMAYGVHKGPSDDDVKLAVNIYLDPIYCHHMSSYEVLSHIQAFIDEINEPLPFYKQIMMVKIVKEEFAKTSTHKIRRTMVKGDDLQC